MSTTEEHREVRAENPAGESAGESVGTADGIDDPTTVAGPSLSAENTDMSGKTNTDTKRSKSAKTARGSSALPWIVLWIVLLLLTAAAGAGGFWLWQQIDSLRAENAEWREARERRENDQIDDKLERLASDVQRDLGAMRSAQSNIEAAQRDLATGIDSVRHFAAKGPPVWLLAEVEYLLRIANHRVNLERDVDTARVALVSADEQLRALADPAYSALRAQIRHEIQLLDATPRIDVEAIAGDLRGLVAVVDQLHLPSDIRIPAARAADATATAAAAADARAWQPDQTPDSATEPDRIDALLDRLVDASKGLVMVRHHNKPISALIDPQHQLLLYEHLKLTLESARINLLRGATETMRSDLQHAGSLVDRFFDTDKPTAQQLLATLERLRERQLEAPMPDISGSLRMLRRLSSRAQSGDPISESMAGAGQ